MASVTLAIESSSMPRSGELSELGQDIEADS